MRTFLSIKGSSFSYLIDHYICLFSEDLFIKLHILIKLISIYYIMYSDYTISFIRHLY